MKELVRWRKRFQKQTFEPMSTTVQKRQAAQAASEDEKAKAEAARKKKEQEAQDNLRAQIRRAQETNQRFDALWNRYQQTPCRESLGILYDNISGLTVEQNGEYPNHLTRRSVQGTDTVKKGNEETKVDWVGERVSWVWNDSSTQIGIKKNKHGKWLPISFKKDKQGKRIHPKNFKLQIERRIVDMGDFERSITLRYFPDNHIEVAGLNIGSLNLDGKSPEQIKEWLDTELGKAMADPLKRPVKSGY